MWSHGSEQGPPSPGDHPCSRPFESTGSRTSHTCTRALSSTQFENTITDYQQLSFKTHLHCDETLD